MLNLTNLLKQKDIQTLLLATDFYFQKGRDELVKWMEMEVSEDLKSRLLKLSSNYEKIQEEAKHDKVIEEILTLLFRIISYCDLKSKDKNLYNEYDDKRALAHAYVRMNNWIEHLVKYKFQKHDLSKGSPKNAFDYLLDPTNHSTMLSENHRAMVVKNLFNKEYRSEFFISDVKTFFQEYNLEVNNPENYTFLLDCILYSIRGQWEEGVSALMASDSTGWQDTYLNGLKSFEVGIIWNSKRPSGTTKTEKYLREFLDEHDSFNLYYCWGGKVNFKAEVLDFAVDSEEYQKKGWEIKYNKIFEYHQRYEDYIDGRKSAKIIFLIQSLTKIKPIEVSHFVFTGEYVEPRQDNLSPVKIEPESIEPGDEDGDSIKVQNSHNPLNQILFGPPGTGKTYRSISKAIAITNPDFDLKQERAKTKCEFDRLVKEGRIVFTTFHQSMSYEDFIEGIKPETLNGNITYSVKSGIFKNLCSNSQIPNQVDFNVAYDKLRQELLDNETIDLKTPTGKSFAISLNSNDNLALHTGPSKEKQGSLTRENIQKQINGEEKFIGWEGYFKGVIIYLETKFGYSSKPKTNAQNFVLIIDEINRGNLSQIFGEIITLIEEDKRLTKPESLEITLPYSKEKFGVPANLYIIGTMNTADRSVEAIDTALRRRFVFEEIPAVYDLVELTYEFAGFKAADILLTINKRIEKLLDKDHVIGHSYFMIQNREKVEEKLIHSFYRHIIPLLQEYFYGDFGKIGLVLGKGFIRKKDWNKDSDSFADFDHVSTADFDDRDVYEIVDYQNPTYTYIVKLSNTDVQMNFQKAIQLLMKQIIE